MTRNLTWYHAGEIVNPRLVAREGGKDAREGWLSRLIPQHELRGARSLTPTRLSRSRMVLSGRQKKNRGYGGVLGGNIGC